MKTSIKRTIGVVALVAAALCAAPTEAQRNTGPNNREGRQFVHFGELVNFQGIDVLTRDGNIVGMTLLQKDGSWLTLKQQLDPTCPATCPAGQQQTCWEDEQQQMSICVCGSATAGKEFLRFRFETTF